MEPSQTAAAPRNRLLRIDPLLERRPRRITVTASLDNRRVLVQGIPRRLQTTAQCHSLTSSIPRTRKLVLCPLIRQPQAFSGRLLAKTLRCSVTRKRLICIWRT